MPLEVFQIVSNKMYNNMYNMYNSFEISPVVFMPNITTNHAITYTNLVDFVLNRKQWKKNEAEAPYFTNWKVLWKRRSLRIMRRFLKEELPSNQVKIPFMNWLLVIIWKVNPFVASVTFSPISNCIQMIGEFLTATFKYTLGWKIFQCMKFLFKHSSNSRKLSRQKFHNA